MLSIILKRNYGIALGPSQGWKRAALAAPEAYSSTDQFHQNIQRRLAGPKAWKSDLTKQPADGSE